MDVQIGKQQCEESMRVLTDLPWHPTGRTSCSQTRPSWGSTPGVFLAQVRKLSCNKEQNVIFQNLCWLFCIQQAVWISGPNNQEGLKIYIMQNFEAILNVSLATNHCPKALAASCTFPAALWPLSLSRFPAQQGCPGQKLPQQPTIDRAQGRNQSWQPGTLELG